MSGRDNELPAVQETENEALDLGKIQIQRFSRCRMKIGGEQDGKCRL
jgi:hypothetical protein